MSIQIKEGLIHDGENVVGYIFNFAGHGDFYPNGKLGIGFTPEQVATHNATLSAAEVKGLDENCEVGQYGTLYWSPTKGVHTWIGLYVADYTLKGRTITFERKGKMFRGRIQKDADCFNFRRVR
jgi:hypothetical protein